MSIVEIIKRDRSRGNLKIHKIRVGEEVFYSSSLAQEMLSISITTLTKWRKTVEGQESENPLVYRLENGGYYYSQSFIDRFSLGNRLKPIS
ncbi:hypothetical protein HYS31_03850 [Candidatus Woesearchaeota archaeon]|nr:hypothetical protein [Candidatus Woesearchaeota archaeon]